MRELQIAQLRAQHERSEYDELQQRKRKIVARKLNDRRSVGEQFFDGLKDLLAIEADMQLDKKAHKIIPARPTANMHDVSQRKDAKKEMIEQELRQISQPAIYHGQHRDKDGFLMSPDDGKKVVTVYPTHHIDIDPALRIEDPTRRENFDHVDAGGVKIQDGTVVDVPLGTNMASEIVKKTDHEQRTQYLDYKIKEFKDNNNFLNGYKGIVLGTMDNKRTLNQGDAAGGKMTQADGSDVSMGKAGAKRQEAGRTADGELIELPLRNFNSPLQRVNKNLDNHHQHLDRNWADQTIPDTDLLHQSLK